MSQPEETKVTTDSTGPKVESKHKTGKGSRAKRTDQFRKKKNDEAYESIMAGVFARLKIKDPTTVPTIPIANEIHPVTVPVTFNVLPQYVDRVWDTMEAIGTRPFSALNTPENKVIFKRGMQILAEVKVCYAQRAHVDKPDESLPEKKLYTSEELNDFNNMAEVLPYPLAMYLECIGNTMDRKQVITPVLAEIEGFENLSGAATFAPRQLLPLLRILRGGVCVDQDVHRLAQALNDLPGIEWEQFDRPAEPPNVPVRMVRLTARSVDRWLDVDNVNGYEDLRIKWTDDDYRTFKKIVQSMGSKKGFNCNCDLSSGQGALAQIVQTPGWRPDKSIEWYAMTDIPEYDQKLGAAFGFGNHTEYVIQPSRFTGTYATAYWRGEITPRRVINAILAGQE